MKIVLAVAVLLVLAEGITLVRICQRNRKLGQLPKQMEQVRAELGQAREIIGAHERNVESLNREITELQQELDKAKGALVAVTDALRQKVSPTEAERRVRSLGLTADDLDLSTLRVVGGTNDANLVVAFAGKSAEEIGVLAQRRQPLVFGRLISREGFGPLATTRYGTNWGMTLYFPTTAEADAVAAEMRGQHNQ